MQWGTEKRTVIYFKATNIPKIKCILLNNNQNYHFYI